MCLLLSYNIKDNILSKKGKRHIKSKNYFINVCIFIKVFVNILSFFSLIFPNYPRFGRIKGIPLEFSMLFNEIRLLLWNRLILFIFPNLGKFLNLNFL